MYVNYYRYVIKLIESFRKKIKLCFPGLSGFHNNAVTVNPQDLASKNHSGSVFGLMNTVGAIPGFLGVYLAGHILELTQSWSAVFSTAAAINFCGFFIFTIFGSAEAII